MASKVVKQLAGNGAGQSLADRVSAAKFSLAGSGLGRGIIKATTEELIPPKKKHLDYLTSCTNEINVSIPDLAELLLDRTLQASWVVVLKAFITTHHLMNFGNEKFSQYMAAKNNKIHLPNFVDKTSSIGYEMSQYIKIYSKYVNEKCTTYRMMAFDFCKIKRGRDDGVLRRMPLDKLMKTLPILQTQIDVLLEFEASTKDLNNPVLSTAFTLLYKDLIRLYASYNEGMINLIEQYFTMKRHMCREALAMYKGFLERTENVNKFVTIAENAGVGDKASLGLQTVPPKVLQTLENHLANLEKRKTSESDEEETRTAVVSSKINPKIKEDIANAAVKAKVVETQSKPKPQPVNDTISHNNKMENNNNLPKSEAKNSIDANFDSEPVSTPVRTQLRRPEQQHSVAVTVTQRSGRSPSPSRPPPHRPTNAPRSREVSPARPQEYDMGHQSRTVHNLGPNNSSPVNGRVSPFSGDEKHLEESGSFWDTVGADTHLTNNTEDGDVDFESAFKDDKHQKSADQEHTKENTSNLLELDLLGLTDSDSGQQNNNQVSVAPLETKSNKYADLDDLFGFGEDSAPSSDNVLAPATMPIQSQKPITPVATSPTKMVDPEDDLLGALSIGLSKDTNPGIKNSVSNPSVSSDASATNAYQSKGTNKMTTSGSGQTKSSGGGLDDTLAALAQSLGKSETKWSSSPKVSTLAGKTLDTIEPSSGSTINWSNSKNDTKTENTTNNNNNNVADILDLFG